VNKSELVEVIAKQAEISKAAAGRALDATIAAIKQSLKKNNDVTLVGFGTSANVRPELAVIRAQGRRSRSRQQKFLNLGLAKL
jgi:fructoselysine-6-P-deglycase FrlB-like protein